MSGAGDLDPRALIRAAASEVAAAHVEVATPERPGVHAERPGDRIGPYELVSELGSGGMGTVWEARQREPIERVVALKIIKRGMDTAAVMKRFDAEIRAQARMEHPGIARVLDAGSTEAGRPYFAMERVHGEPVCEWCDRTGAGVRERVELVIDVCAAVQHAHRKGVVHRDIKPSNVLVAEDAGRPVVKVIDFGVAKAVAEDAPLLTEVTSASQIIGTVDCMAPEQTFGGAADVDTRTDVWGIGALLYRMLAGAMPFDGRMPEGATMEERLRVIRELDPVRPSQRVDTFGATPAGRRSPSALRARLSGELDWITLKALEKEPERRYGSVAELGADLVRFLAGDAVVAGPPSRVYRISRFVRRNRALVLGSLLAVALLIAGVVGTSIGLVRALSANERLLASQEREARQRMRAQETSRTLADVLTRVAPRLARGKDTTLLEAVLGDMSARLAAGEIAEPLVEAELDQVAGVAFQRLGRLDEAIRHFERAAASRAQVLGPDHAASLRSKLSLASARVVARRPGEAEPVLREIIEVVEPGSGLGLEARTSLGQLLADTGRRDGARALLAEVVDRERRDLGPAGRARSAALPNLAMLLMREFNDQAGALALLEEGIALADAELDPDDPQTIRLKDAAAGLLAEMGELERSLALAEDLQRAYGRIFGPEHRATLLSRTNMTVTLQWLDRHAEAETILEETLETQSRLFGRGDDETLWTLAQLALVRDHLGADTEAEALYREVIESYRTGNLPPDSSIFTVRMNLGSLLYDGRRFAEAKDVFTAVLADLKRLLGDEHPWTESTLSKLRMTEQALAGR